MAQLQQLLSLILIEFCYLQLTLCALNVEMPNVPTQLRETDNKLGPLFIANRLVPLTMKCSISSDSAITNLNVKWYVKNVPQPLDGNRYEITTTQISDDKKNFTSTLVIKYPSAEDFDEYTCTAAVSDNTAVNKSATFLSLPLLSFSSGANGKSYSNSDVSVWAGESISINCDVRSFLNFSIKWMKNGEFVSSNETFKLNEVSYESDRGNIQCIVNNEYGQNTATLFLRVKNPKAFLLPLILLIVQISIIAAIVGAYEFRRKQRAKAEENKAD